MNTLTYFDIKRLIHTGALDISFNNNLYRNKLNNYLINLINKYDNNSILINNNNLNNIINNEKYIYNLDLFLRNYTFNNLLSSMVNLNNTDSEVKELYNNTKLNNFIFLKPRFIDNLYVITNEDSKFNQYFKLMMNIIFKRNIQIPFTDRINELPLGINIECKKNLNSFLKLSLKSEFKDCGYTIINDLIYLEKGIVIDKVFIQCSKNCKPFLPYQDMIDMEIIN